MSGLQNGSPDGIALIDNVTNVVEFFSYEGSFVAGDGPATGVTSTDIGVAEDGSTAVGNSLQLIGTGSTGADFAWTGPVAHSRGFINMSQDITDLLPEEFLRGDASGDGIFNGLSDGLAILEFQFTGGAEPPCMEAADADGNGIFNGLADALYVLEHQFLAGPPPPEPYPTCGVDPEPISTLGCDTFPVCP